MRDDGGGDGRREKGFEELDLGPIRSYDADAVRYDAAAHQRWRREKKRKATIKMNEYK